MNDKVIMGFEFKDEFSYNQAKDELEKIQKIKGDYNIKDIGQLLSLYNRLIDEEVYQTPVGITFLKTIQKELYGKANTLKQSIRNIPAASYDSNAKGGGLKGGDTQKTKKGAVGKYKDLYIKMLIINVVLVVTIGVMFVITKHSEKYDLDYYRESIENDYINWENNLKEREAALTQQEKSD